MIGRVNNTHIVNEASSILKSSQVLAINGVRVEHTVIFRVENNTVEWACADSGKYYRIFGWIDYFSVQLF